VGQITTNNDEEGSVMRFFNYLRALRMCAVQCFNANQVTNHEHEWLHKAVLEEEKAFADLPKWARLALKKYM
jgi:hypothetical protein